MIRQNKRIPELRFSEFQEEEGWREKTLEELVYAENSNKVLNKLDLKSSGFPVYGADRIAGYISDYQHDREYISVVKDGSGVGRLSLCQPRSSILGTLTALRSTDERLYNLPWLFYLLHTVDFTVYVKGSGIPHIYYSDFKDEIVGVCGIKEQQKIAACLSSLDEVITAHSKKLELLKEHKKGLMQKMFPPVGKKVPEYRFKEFEKDGQWEKKKLGDMAIFMKGKGISKSDIIKGGKVPCIRYGELYTQYNEIINDVVSYTDLPVDDLILSKANDVIIPASGETHEDIATASCVIKEGIALGGDLNIIRSEVNGIFLSYYLNNVKSKEIAQLAQGISVIHLYSRQLQNLIIQIPSEPEQQKIAICFSSLDQIIGALIEKIDLMKQQKKGLMQRLFPAVN